MSRRVLLTIAVFFIAATGVFAGGSNEKQDSAVKKDDLTVVVSTNIAYDVVSRIAGDNIVVHGLMDYGQDPHSYEPSPRDIALVESADLVIVNGFGLEEGLLKTLETVANVELLELSSDIKAVEMGEHEEHDAHEHEEEDDHTDNRDNRNNRDNKGKRDEHDDHEEHEAHEHEDDDHEHEEHEAHDEHHHEGEDPHVWMSPLNVISWTKTAAKALAELDPGHAGEYAQRAAAYQKELKALDTTLRKELASIPKDQRVIVADHDVFGYFARDYGFRVIGTIIPGYSTSAEPSAKEISELLEVLEHEGVQAIFVSESTGTGVMKLAETIKHESGKDIQVLPYLSGSLRKEGETGDSYIGFMEYNTAQILSALEE